MSKSFESRLKKLEDAAMGGEEQIYLTITHHGAKEEELPQDRQEGNVHLHFVTDKRQGKLS